MAWPVLSVLSLDCVAGLMSGNCSDRRWILALVANKSVASLSAQQDIFALLGRENRCREANKTSVNIDACGGTLSNNNLMQRTRRTRKLSVKFYHQPLGMLWKLCVVLVVGS
jgi:hypothetical protein